MAQVSVIIPAHNQAAYIADAVQSVCDQTFTDWELVVVDDGSTDSTLHVLAGFQDSRICVVRQANKGVSAARNTGIRYSSAPLITFLDADDFFMPDAIAVLYANLTDYPEVGLVIGGGQRVDLSGRTYEKTIIIPTHLGFPELLFENDILIGSVMVRREWLELVGGFDESLHTNEDWDLWLRLVVEGCRLLKLEKIVMTYRIHMEQVTQDVDKMRTDTLGLWEKFFNLPNLPSDLLAFRNPAVASALVRTSARAFRVGEFEMGNSDLFEAIKLDPNLGSAGYRRLVDLLRGWANDPRTQDPKAYLLAVSNHVTPKLPGLRHQLRKAVAAMILGSLFGTSQEVRRTQRKALIKAILYDPSWITNRGVLRMIVEAWFMPSPKRAT